MAKYLTGKIIENNGAIFEGEGIRERIVYYMDSWGDVLDATKEYFITDFLIDEPEERKGIIVLEEDTNPFPTMAASFDEGWFDDLLPKKAYKISKAEEKPEEIEVRLLELTGKKSLRKIRDRLIGWFEYVKEITDLNSNF